MREAIKRKLRMKLEVKTKAVEGWRPVKRGG